MANILSLCANVVLLAVNILYISSILWGDTKPNPATWFIAFVATLVSTLSYIGVVGGNPTEMALPVLALIGTGLICFCALMRNTFTKVNTTDKIVMVLSVMVGCVGWVSGNAVATNIAMQFVMVAAFWPTVSGLLKGKGHESWVPWTLAVVSYSLQIATIAADPTGSHWTEFAQPVANGVLGNGSVVLAILWTSRRSTR